MCSIAGSVGTPAVNSTDLTLPTAPILGAAPVVSPVVAPLASMPPLAGLGLGLQVPTASMPIADTIGVPSECLLLKNMFDPKIEVVGQIILRYFSFYAPVAGNFLNDLMLLQTEPDFDLDIKEDVQDECSKFGTLEHIFVEK